jgi:hypothetical protein
MRTIYKYKFFGNTAVQMEIPNELYPDKKAAAAWINMMHGTMIKPSMLHWRLWSGFKPTNNCGTH